MFVVLVCDDNAPYTAMLVKMLSNYADIYDIEVKGYQNGIDLMDYCRSNKFDIVYMDVELKETNGMILAGELKKINPQSLIIYISDYDDYFAEMVNAEPFSFISKELSIAELEKRIEKTLKAAIKRINPQDLWTFEFNKMEYNVSLESVKCFRSVARKIYIDEVTGGASKYFYGKLDEIEKAIISIDDQYIRINKSYFVNMRWAGLLGNNQIRLGNKVIKVSRKYQEEFNRRKKMSRWRVYAN
ncbi:MAG: response regulator [Lachnospiraceae bacterium]|nr:hypothetical protein C819_02217 [Lachnospiraceae bacterium 10-1]MCX4350394.1 response regulator [Lachnospiraceae bacterium]